MLRHNAPARAMAIGLAALAGYVDAIGFVITGGAFVSFMTGNSTRLAVGTVDPGIDIAAAGALIALFVLGVAGGTILGHVAREHRRPAILATIAVLLAIAAAAGGADRAGATAMLLALAMGAENAVFERDGEIGIGLTYMTGALVRIGHGLGGLALGRRTPGWSAYLLLWTGLIIGACAGAMAQARLGIAAIWIASAMAAGWAIVAARASADQREARF